MNKKNPCWSEDSSPPGLLNCKCLVGSRNTSARCGRCPHGYSMPFWPLTTLFSSHNSHSNIKLHVYDKLQHPDPPTVTFNQNRMYLRCYTINEMYLHCYTNNANTHNCTCIAPHLFHIFKTPQKTCLWHHNFQCTQVW